MPNDAVVIIAQKHNEKSTGKRLEFKDFLIAKRPSLRGVDLTRDRSPIRRVKL